MADSLGTAYVTLRADLKALKEDFDKAQTLTEKAAYGMEAVGKKIAGIDTSTLKIGIAAAGAAAVAMAKVSVDAFIEQENAVAKLNAVLKSTGDATGIGSAGMQQIANDMQSVTTYADEVILNSEAILATFTKINDPDIFKETIASSADLSAVMGQDLQSSVVQLGKALNDPIQGVAALRRVGVSFTAEQMEQIKVMQESGDLMGAQKLVLAELKKEFGGAAEAAGTTFGGQMTQLKNTIGEAEEALGALIANTIGPFIPMLKDAADGAKLFIESLAGVKSTKGADEMGKALGAIDKQIADLKKNQSGYNEESKYYQSIQGKIANLEDERSKLIKDYTSDVEKAGKVQHKTGKDDVELTKEQIKAKEEYKKIASEAIASIGTKEEQLVEKFKYQMSQIKGHSKEANDARYALELKLSEDLQDVWGGEEDEYKAIRQKQMETDNDWAGNFMAQMEESSGANKSFFDQMGEVGAAWGAATKDMFKNVYEDALKGDLQNAQTYLDAFKNAMISAIAAVLAEQTMAAAAAAYANVAAAEATTVAWVAAYSAMTLGVVALALAVIANWKDVEDSLNGNFNVVGDGLLTLVNLPLETTLVTARALKEAFEFIKNIFTSAWESGPVKTIRDLFQGIYDIFKGIADAIKTIVDTLNSLNPIKGIGNIGGDVGDSVGNIVAPIVTTTTDIVGGAAEWVGSALGFAKGGVMTKYGPLPLNNYAGGGIANKPQMAIFGEGSTPEAVVPLPDGKSIPVTVNGGGGGMAQVILQIDGRMIASVLADLSRTGRLKLDRSAVMA